MAKTYEITEAQYSHIVTQLHETKKLLKAITEEIDAKKKTLNEANALNEGIVDTLKRYLSVGMLPLGIMISLLVSQKASPEQMTQAGVPPQKVQQAVELAKQHQAKQIPTMQQAQQGVVKEMFDDYEQKAINHNTFDHDVADNRKNVITSFELMPLEKQAEILFNKGNYLNVKNSMIKSFTKNLSILSNPNQIAEYLIKLVRSVPGIMLLIDPALLANTSVIDVIKNKDQQVYNYLLRAKKKANVG